MRRLLRLSLRSHLMVLVLLALLPAFALTIYNTVDDDRRATAEVKNTARRLVLPAARNHEQMIDDAHDLLMLLTRFPAKLLDPQVCQKLMTSVAEPYPNFVNVIVLDPPGNVICSGQPRFIGFPAVGGFDSTEQISGLACGTGNDSIG